jgi:glutamate-1-semialdehyde 2,1-aminomutase
MTGFRVAYGGAQQLYGVTSDITTLGKIIGGGMPVGAFGASAEIMGHLSPEGPAYQAGTLSGNPIAMAAGLATLEALREESFYDRLEARSAALSEGLRAAAAQSHLAAKVCFNRVGSMLCCFFTGGPVCDYAQASSANTDAFAAYFHAMLDNGVYLAPSGFEAMFVSAAHTDSDIGSTIDAGNSCRAWTPTICYCPEAERPRHGHGRRWKGVQDGTT